MSSDTALYLLPDRREHPFRNMEEDLLLLYQNPAVDSILFRHYEWEFPCWTCGYSQKFDYVQNCTGGNEKSIYRRATGGGIVPHHNDWTFTMLIGKEHPNFILPPREFYEILHARIAEILYAHFEIPAALHECKDDICNGAPPAECFRSPVLSDVLLGENGEKVAGAAIKKTREGILLQGSIQKTPLPDLDWSRFKAELSSVLSSDFASPLKTMEWPYSSKETYPPYGERIHCPAWLGK